MIATPARTLRLFALILCLAPGARAAEVVGQYVVSDPREGFGGLSGLELDAGGARFLALSDRGVLFQGRFRRDATGAVTGMDEVERQPLHEADGTLLKGRRRDAEGLALTAGGRIFISFELDPRVVEYGHDGQLLAELPVDPAFRGFGKNDGMEALAVAADGTLLVMPEGPWEGTTGFPVFRLGGGQWDQPFSLADDHSWRPAGADFGPDGRLYLLERDFWAPIGFKSRLRRITLDGARVTADEVIWQTVAGQYSNLESPAIWRDATGALRVTMVSDNNFLPVMATTFVDLRLDD